MPRSSRWAIPALSTTVVIWASTFVISEDALSDIRPAALTVARFTVAAALLVPFALARGMRPAALFHKVHVVCGLTGVALYFGLQNIGLQTSGSDTAALLQAALPALTVIIAVAWLRERTTVRQLAGTALIIAGIVIVVGGGVPNPGPAEAAILLGIAAYAFYTAYLRRHAAQADPVMVAAGSAVCGLGFLAPWLVWEVAEFGLPQVTAQSAVAVVYLGALASAATLLLWTVGLRGASASTAGAFTGAIPALGYVFALATGHALSWPKLGGAAIALVGVAIVSRTRAAVVQPEDPTATQLRACSSSTRGDR